MRCDIVMATWNAVEMTRKALESIKNESAFPYRLILVDNSEQEEARACYREIALSGEYGETLLIQNERNVGWLKATNIGLRHVDAEYVCLLNNDVICGTDWLRRCVNLIERVPEIGLINPRGNERSENNKVADINAYALKLHREQGGLYTEMDRCSGYCMFARSRLFQEYGLLDEIFDGGYFEDFDFSRRIQSAGLLCAQCDDAFVFHLGSQSFKQVPEGPKRAMHDRNREICYGRWGKPRRIFLRIGDGAADVGYLHQLIRKNRVYLLENRHVPAEIRAMRHGNLELKHNRWLWEPLYFLLKSWQWAAKKRIDEAVTLYQ